MYIYDFILTLSSQSVIKIKNAWERELGKQLSEEVWEHATDRIRSTTSCARLGLIQFKVLYRVHFSKSRLSELYPEVEDKCDKCRSSPCHLSHMFFFCPDLNGFWTGYFTIMSTVLNLRPCSLIAIFGIPDASLVLNSMQKDIIAYTSLLARRALHWKSAKYPSISRWLTDTMFFFKT